MSALLELNDLKKHFLVRRGPLGLGTTTVRAVDGVSFHIDRGETLALAATYSDRTHSQGASSDPGEGSLSAASQRQTVVRLACRGQRSCCARAASGHAAAAPPSSVMKSRRFSRSNGILPLPARARLQDIELTIVSQPTF
jgi:hypothetical protein